MKCYNCRNEVHESEARTIGQVIVVCGRCYHQLRALIFNGYFDVQAIEDGLIEEREIQTHISARA